MTTRYEALKKERDELRRKLQDAAKDHFKELAATVFVEHPVLQSFAWTQYTPYFNDGEECVFGAHTSNPHLKFGAQPVDGEAEEPEDEEDDYFYDKRNYKGSYAVPGFPNTPQEKAGCAVIDFLGTFDDADLKEMFGDHIKVTVSRSGVDVDEYSHD